MSPSPSSTFERLRRTRVESDRQAVAPHRTAESAGGLDGQKAAGCRYCRSSFAARPARPARSTAIRSIGTSPLPGGRHERCPSGRTTSTTSQTGATARCPTHSGRWAHARVLERNQLPTTIAFHRNQRLSFGERPAVGMQHGRSAHRLGCPAKGANGEDRDQLWTHNLGFPVPSSVPLMYQFLPRGS